LDESIRVKRFSELSPGEQNSLLKHVINGIHSSNSLDLLSLNNMVRSIFNDGQSYFTVWREVVPIGCIGCLVKDVSTKGIAYLAGISFSSEDRECFSEVLKTATEYVARFNPSKLKLGITPHYSFLTSLIIDSGFEVCDRALVLKHDKTCFRFNRKMQINLAPVSHANRRYFLDLYNNCFIDTPNATVLSLEELDRALKSSNTSIYGFAKFQQDDIGVFELARSSSTGSIEAMAIAPDFRNQGYGEQLLHSILNHLYKNCAQVKLVVMETNTAAKKLYESNGFLETGVKSIWFEARPIF